MPATRVPCTGNSHARISPRINAIGFVFFVQLMWMRRGGGRLGRSTEDALICIHVILDLCNAYVILRIGPINWGKRMCNTKAVA